VASTANQGYLALSCHMANMFLVGKLVVKSDQLDEEYLVDKVLACVEFDDEAFVCGVLS
jgi:hypothetical protein